MHCAAHQPLENAVKPELPNIVTSAENAYWKAVRQGAAPCFSNNSIRKVLPVVLEKTLNVVERIAAVAAANPDNAAFDVSDGAKRITSDVMGQLLLAEDLGGTRWLPSKYLEVFYPVLKAQAAQINNPWHLLQLWKPEVRQQRRCLSLHNKIMDEKVRQVKARPPPDYTVAAHLLAVEDPATGNPLTLNQLKAEISVFMAAGFETTSHAITWTLAALAVHPEVQEKLYQELLLLGLADDPTNSKASRTGDAGGVQQNIDAAHLGRLPYMQGVLKEVLRLCPPAPWGGTKMVTDQAAEVCGYTLPKGSYVMIPTMALCLSSRNYGPDTILFKPERWLTGSKAATCIGAVDHDDLSPAGSDQGGGGQHDATCWASAGPFDGAADEGAGSGGASERSHGSLRGGGAGEAVPPDPLTFMAGPRDCIGQSLAKLELQVVTATLVSRFMLTPGEKLQHEMAVAAATGRSPMAAIHALAAAHVTLQPTDGHLLLRFAPRC
eukprot:gene10115-10272_t